ncbi:hypothetical protein CANMA_003255 [Candida margitis]|uniref:uncharacterized protein n=1 Tax=Candida margitis TaxID=1775924 RepID=UPI002227A35A|nr:uncharacterized protein CANMA_003255 [Candida margitis]KAI5967198.1 hypothetical protein CANMA_003255 [Candida margitis]
MSDELGETCDHFLKTTTILSHQYGIPQVQRQQDFTSWSHIHNLEKQYYAVYQDLTHKLNHLMYLTKLKEVSNLDDISHQIDQIKQAMDIDDLDELYQFIQLQNDVVKTDSLLNRFLLMSSPILKAINQASLNTSEMKILDHLGILYNEGGLVYKVQEIENKNRDEVSQPEKNPFELIYTDIKPLMDEVQQLDAQFKQLQLKYISNKENKVEENEEARTRYHGLVSRWHKLDRLCLLLILLITSLPYAWSTDESLMTMMLDLNDMRDKLAKYQSVVNKDNIDDFTSRELLSLEFD